MKALCYSCAHRRGGCNCKDEDGLHTCEWAFDYDHLDPRDPSNWPDDSDFEEEEKEDEDEDDDTDKEDAPDFDLEDAIREHTDAIATLLKKKVGKSEVSVSITAK